MPNYKFKILASITNEDSDEKEPEPVVLEIPLKADNKRMAIDALVGTITTLADEGLRYLKMDKSIEQIRDFIKKTKKQKEESSMPKPYTPKPYGTRPYEWPKKPRSSPVEPRNPEKESFDPVDPNKSDEIAEWIKKKFMF